MPIRTILHALLAATVLLLIPYTASFYVDGWLWTGSDYVFAWVLFSFVSLAVAFAVQSAKGIVYKLAVGLAAATAFLVVWINAAVGLIGDRDINMVYPFVVLGGIIAAALVQSQPRGMSRTLVGLAVAQMAVPVLALTIDSSNFSPGILRVFLLNGFFALMWGGSALLFQHAARKHSSS